MLSGREFKRIRGEITNILKEITEHELFNNFIFYDEIPTEELQYWKYDISIIDEDFTASIQSVCGYFVASQKVMQNRECNINSFFRINDIIAEEFYYIDNMNGPLNKLANSLKEIKSFAETEFSISIGVNACINNKCQWLREVCDESLLIIHSAEDEEFVDVSCMMSERYDLRCTKENNDNKVELLRIPFDKVKYFDNFERIDNRTSYYHEEEKANYVSSNDNREITENTQQEEKCEVSEITSKKESHETTYEKICELIKGVWTYRELIVDFTQKRIIKDGIIIKLGKKQMEILKILVYNKGNIISREQIIQYVWCNDEVNDRTVDAHISKIRRELGLECIKSVPGYGYRLE